MRSAITALAAGFVFALCATSAASERGLPLISVHPAEIHRAGPQTFDVAQGHDGILYFGNLGGLLTYDGASWNLIQLPDEQAVLAIASDARGRVVLGLVDDAGYLGTDANGSIAYRSLLPLIAAGRRSFGDVRGICTAADGFLIAAQRRTFFWDGKAMHPVAEHTPEEMPRGCLGDTAGAWHYGRGGVRRFDARTRALAAPAVNGHADAVVRTGGGVLLAAIRGEGFAAIGEGAIPPASAWLKGKRVMDAQLLADGRIAVATYSHGLLIIGRDGGVDQIIDEESGLPAAVLTSVFLDREGSLWLTMDGPIARIDLLSPVSLFDVRSGLRGTVSDVARHEGTLYVASSHGLYTIDPGGRAQQIGAVTEGGWRLAKVGGELLATSPRAIYRVSGMKAEPVVTTHEQVYDIAPSADPSRIWIASRNGLGMLRRDGARWTLERLPTRFEYIATVIERGGVLWCGTVFDGVLRIENPGTPSMRVQQFGDGEMNVALVGGSVVIVKASGQILVTSDGRLVPHPLLGRIAVPGGFFNIAEDRGGNVWLNSTPPRIVRRLGDGTYAREPQPLVSVTAMDIQTVRVTEDNLVWFCSDKGLFRYTPSSAPVQQVQPEPLIRRVTAGGDRLLFGGRTRPGAEPVSLRHDLRRVRIEYAPASYRPGVEFQYRLDPIDGQWSSWTKETFVDFTTLEANDYTFRLRARGAATAPSPEVAWSFTVLPPWYRATWAMLLWVVAAGALLLAIIRIRTGALRRHAMELEARVAEQTSRLQQTVELLEQANARLEMLSMADDLTGIANRRYFQRALNDEWNRARRQRQPLSLILIDLDHFKTLNDRRGHPAGDESLRRVGAMLGEMIRRSGEVVARYGGEEFAVLLPNVDAADALRVAETIRAAVAELRIDLGEQGEHYLTTSCGVSTLTPDDDVTPADLIEQADRALYAAKHAGKNCVRAAEPMTAVST